MLTERDLLCIVLELLKDKTGDHIQEIKQGEERDQNMFYIIFQLYVN